MGNRRRKKSRMRKRFIFLFMVLLGILLVAAAYFGIKGYQMYRTAATEKPVAERVEEIRDAEGFTPYSALPEFYVEAVISVEDHRFEKHCGIDPIAIARAAWMDVKAGAFIQGGSTITQQLAKNMFFTQKKELERKAAEVFTALALEAAYSKDEIFELYANTVYFGNGYYGISQASRGYFGKEPSDLTPYECAMLAGIPNAPSVYSSNADGELIRQRTKFVLDRMAANKMITREEKERIESGL